MQVTEELIPAKVHMQLEGIVRPLSKGKKTMRIVEQKILEGIEQKHTMKLAVLSYDSYLKYK